MNKFLFFIVSFFTLVSCTPESVTLEQAIKNVQDSDEKIDEDYMEIKHLTYKDFLTKIFNFEQPYSTWKSNGERPIIIDFYAEWCQPCKRLSPILDSISSEYDGKIEIFKVDIDHEPELASACNIKNIPALIFIPKGEKEPVVSVGLIGKNDMRSIIKEVFDLSRAGF